MGRQLIDLGEEWLWKTDVSAETGLDYGVYDDSADTIGDTADLSSITSEPAGAGYSRQSTSITVRDISGDWGFDNDTDASFNLTDSSTGSIDSYLVTACFQASGDASATEHLVATGCLSQTYDVNSVSSFTINASTAGVTVN